MDKFFGYLEGPSCHINTGEAFLSYCKMMQYDKDESFKEHEVFLLPPVYFHGLCIIAQKRLLKFLFIPTPFLWCSPHKLPFIGVPDKTAKVFTSLPTSPLLLQGGHDEGLRLPGSTADLFFP